MISAKLLFVVGISMMLMVKSSDQQQIQREDEVLVLTASNFDDAIIKHKNILVKFYAPWCGHCKSLAPEYASAAKKLKDENAKLYLGKVDATVESELAKRFAIGGYPTLKYFQSGTPSDYTGGRSADEIIGWMKKFGN